MGRRLILALVRARRADRGRGGRVRARRRALPRAVGEHGADDPRRRPLRRARHRRRPRSATSWSSTRPPAPRARTRCAAAARRPRARCARSRPGTRAEVQFVKRVVAEGGDEISMRDGKLIRNGKPETTEGPAGLRGADGCDFPRRSPCRRATSSCSATTAAPPTTRASGARSPRTGSSGATGSRSASARSAAARAPPRRSGPASARRHRAHVVAGLVPAREVEVDEVDRRDAGRANGVWSSVISGCVPAGNAAPAPTRLAAARRRAHSCGSEPASRGIRSRLSATKSSRTTRAQLAAVAARVGLRAAQAGSRRSRPVVGRLLAVEEHEAQLRRALRPLRAAQHARELEHRGGAARAVVGADEARQRLRVVVRGDDDRRLRAREAADDVAQPGMAGDRLEAPARQRPAQARREPPRAAEPAGRGPSSTWRRSSANARRPSKRSAFSARGAPPGRRPSKPRRPRPRRRAREHGRHGHADREGLHQHVSRSR